MSHRDNLSGDQSKQRLPGDSTLCRCFECSKLQVIDASTGDIVSGSYVSKRKFKKHKAASKAQGFVPTVAGNLDPPPADPRLAGLLYYTSTSDCLLDVIATLNPRHEKASAHGRLQFKFPPSHTATSLFLRVDDEDDGKEVNSGAYSLEPGHPDNTNILHHEEWLYSSYLAVELALTHKDIAVRLRARVLVRKLEITMKEVEDWKQLEWEKQRKHNLLVASAPAHPIIPPAFSEMDDATKICMLMAAVIYLYCAVSMDHMAFVLASLQSLLETVVPMILPHGIKLNQKYLASKVPGDIRTVIKDLRINPVTKSYVCCPKCFKCYPIDDKKPYPDRCTKKETPSSKACDRELRKLRTIMGKEKSFPCRKFEYHDLKDWIGRLLNRPGMEAKLDRDVYDTQAPPGRSTDIWDSPIMQEFKGPDNLRFVRDCGDEARLVFSICMDGLNPFGNKHGGRRVSVCAIYLVCMNIPAAERYRYENMFLAGVVPGPNEPSLHQINHVLEPLVDDLSELWYDGAKFCTGAHPSGRDLRAAMVPLVSDLVAARQMAGLAPHSATPFCSFCKLKIQEIDNLDMDSWVPRDCDEHRIIATSWRDAESEKEREKIYETHGVRWTELMRLPYWNSVKHTTLDCMHLLYLGDLARHCRRVWGLDIKFEDGLGVTYDQLLDQTNKRGLPIDFGKIQEARDALEFGSNKELGDVRLAVLKQVCAEKDLRFGGKKRRLLRQLFEYRERQGWPRTASSNITRPTPASSQPNSVHVGGLAASINPTPQPSSTPSYSAPKTTGATPRNISVPPRISNASPDANTDVVARVDFGAGSSTVGTISPGEARNSDASVSLADPRIQNVKKSARKDHPLTQQDLDDGVRRMSNGLSIKSLKKPVLAALCVTRINQAEEVCLRMKNLELVAVLEAWRSDRPLVAKSAVDTSADLALQIESAEKMVVSRTTTKTQISKIRMAALVVICASRFADGTSLKGIRKQDLVNKMVDWRVENGLVQEKQRKTRVLGRNMVAEIWRDMVSLSIPSWVSPAPKTVGSAQAGSLGADEWRSLCTINLPVTLIRLWGPSPPESREHQMLTNFMDLVSAVKLASMRTMTKNRASDYTFYMHRYLTKLLDLYPGAEISPNQHMSMHLEQVLLDFGPSHSFRSFGFERSNYLLQQIPTNNKVDDLAATLLNRFCMKQNLRALFTTQNVPAPLERMMSVFEKSFHTDVRGTLLNDTFVDSHGQAESQALPPARSEDETVIPFEIMTLLRSWHNQYGVGIAHEMRPKAQFHKSATFKGFQVHTAANSQKDCFITFYRKGSKAWSAGRVRNIFSHTWMQGDTRTRKLFIVVDTYVDLNAADAVHDPYRLFPVAGGRLFYNRFFPEHCLVTEDNIFCHFARAEQVLPGSATECILALPLDKD